MENKRTLYIKLIGSPLQKVGKTSSPKLEVAVALTNRKLMHPTPTLNTSIKRNNYTLSDSIYIPYSLTVYSICP